MDTRGVAMSEIDDPNQNINQLIRDLIKKLNSRDELVIPEVRKKLTSIGKPAVPYLISALASSSDHLRWEATIVLGEIGDPIAVEALISALQDENIGVRWMAMDSLIKLDQAVILPLLLALRKDSESIRLREGAHHILHILKDRKHLPPQAIKVFEALESIEPDIAVPWAVEDALEKYQIQIEK
jgi:HEAT repeat protein